jgi:hypothetical protein
MQRRRCVTTATITSTSTSIYIIAIAISVTIAVPTRCLSVPFMPLWKRWRQKVLGRAA